MRQTAENWLEVSDRVFKYRRDQLNDTQTHKLLNATSELKLRLKEKADASKLKLSIESLEGVLRDTGGRIYPVSSLVENVEFFLVAAIVILGLRAYFVQPFKIPTNSMWPTYYGMTAEIFKSGEEPGVLGSVSRLVRLGATNYSATAPADGQVYIAAYGDTQFMLPVSSEITGRSLLIFPSAQKEFTFSVGGQTTTVKVPAEFDFNKLLRDAFFKDAPNVEGALAKAAWQAQPLEQSTLLIHRGNRTLEARVYWVPIGKSVKKGAKFLSFDILTGDLLFVDRFSYNFFPPKVGSGFVFKTKNIHSPNMLDRNTHEQIDQYYIKRLVGGPGDELEVRKPAKVVANGVQLSGPGQEGELFRNGKPIDGAAAFAKNARKDGLYPGYRAAGLLDFGSIVKIPQHSYFAMGDNSPNSEDSRFWGFVPEKDVVGRPLFIYYPLTSRWGPAK
ncbi:MAG: signal peptidase I [Lacunisphaera sp.]